MKVLFGIVLGLAATLGTVQEPHENVVKILFVGNSYVHTNSLPRTFAALAEQADPPLNVEWEMQAPGGCSFKRHCLEEGTLELIKEGSFDYVLLQEQSTHFIEEPETSVEYGNELIATAKESGAKVILLSTWARLFDPTMLPIITKGYESLSKDVKGVEILRAGECFAALDKGINKMVYKKDGSHPSPLGTYLVACMLYGHLAEYPVVDFGDLWQGRVPEKVALSVHEAVSQYVPVFGTQASAIFKRVKKSEEKISLRWEKISGAVGWMFSSLSGEDSYLIDSRNTFATIKRAEIEFDIDEGFSVIPIYFKANIKQGEGVSLSSPGIVWFNEDDTSNWQVFESTSAGPWDIPEKVLPAGVAYFASSTVDSRRVLSQYPQIKKAPLETNGAKR